MKLKSIYSIMGERYVTVKVADLCTACQKMVGANYAEVDEREEEGSSSKSKRGYDEYPYDQQKFPFMEGTGD